MPIVVRVSATASKIPERKRNHEYPAAAISWSTAARSIAAAALRLAVTVSRTIRPSSPWPIEWFAPMRTHRRRLATRLVASHQQSPAPMRRLENIGAFTIAFALVLLILVLLLEMF
jgi:hypothetical protein